ncbi:MAG: site-specific recombinase [bacterium]|nr:site-specific recombinase [bacterium]
MPLPLKAGIWIRVSTEEQARGESPKHHEARARAYAELKGWEVVEIYDLSGVSGKEILSHPETQRMLDDVRKGRIQALIFSKLARLARNVKELLEIAEIFQKYNANLVSLDENIDTSSPAGRLLFVVIGALAQWEREEIAERVRASVPVRARMGKNTGGIGPFGYKWENGKLVINPDEAYVVKRAYQLYLETGKLLTTCRRLTEEGLKARKSNFTTVTLKRMLTDTVYKGLKRANYTKTRGKGKSWELKPEEDWVYFKVEPIVDEGLWEKVNEMIRKNEENYKEMRVPKEGRYLFSGLVVCGLCGKKMYVYPYERMKEPIYRCRCRNKIRESILENKFKEGLEHLVVHPESFKKIEDEERFKIEELKERKEGMERELRKVKHKIDKLFSLWEDELIDKKSFRERFEELNRQKEEIEEAISRIQAEIDFYSIRNTSLDFILDQAKKMKDMWDLLEEDEKKEMVKLLLEKIQVGDGKITFFYNCPSEFIQLENDNHNLKEVDLMEAQSLVGLACAIRAVRHCGSAVGKDAAVIGSGHSAMLILQVLKAGGINKLTLIGGKRISRLRLAEELGADLAISYSSADLNDRLREFSPEGFDIVIEASGSASTIPLAINMVKPGGKIIVFSTYKERASNIPLEELYYKEITIQGSRAGSGEYQTASALLASGKVKVKPMITHVVEITEAAKGFEIASSNDEKVFRVVMKIGA